MENGKFLEKKITYLPITPVKIFKREFIKKMHAERKALENRCIYLGRDIPKPTKKKKGFKKRTLWSVV